jgi:acetate kinase
MGTRSGDVDPGLLLHLQKTLGYSPDDLERLLNRESGLLGVSGISNDVRDLEAQAQVGNPPAKLALDLFAYRVAKTIGAYYVALEGVDAIAFSGGIGENGAAMRERICRRLKPIGVILDSERNSRAVPPDVGTLCLSSHESPVSVWAIRADENRQMLEEIRSFLLKLSL